MLEMNYMPIWIETDGTIWEYRPDGEPCEFDSYPPDELFENIGYTCWQPSEYVGRSRDGRVIYICTFHFEPIKDTTILSSIEA